jgi:SAM-dependent methyltransferase
VQRRRKLWGLSEPRAKSFRSGTCDGRALVTAGFDLALNSRIMAHPSWNESYASGLAPWDTGVPEPLLVEFVTSGSVAPGRTLEIGAGTGTNAIWLAERGFDVVGIDISSLAVERANAKLNGRALSCRFATLDFLAAPPSDGPFHFVFDRGCFHVFDEPAERARFAVHIAATLAPGGLWLSLIGSTEGPPREVGPPRRSAREIALAIEPALEIIELRSAEFRSHEAKAWFCLSRQRTIPAQPSTRHD